MEPMSSQAMPNWFDGISREVKYRYHLVSRIQEGNTKIIYQTTSEEYRSFYCGVIYIRSRYTLCLFLNLPPLEKSADLGASTITVLSLS